FMPQTRADDLVLLARVGRRNVVKSGGQGQSPWRGLFDVFTRTSTPHSTATRGATLTGDLIRFTRTCAPGGFLGLRDCSIDFLRRISIVCSRTATAGLSPYVRAYDANMNVLANFGAVMGRSAVSTRTLYWFAANNAFFLNATLDPAGFERQSDVAFGA